MSIIEPGFSSALLPTKHDIIPASNPAGAQKGNKHYIKSPKSSISSTHTSAITQPLWQRAQGKGKEQTMWALIRPP